MTQDDPWKLKLDPARYHILREHGTEPPFSGEYTHCRTPGTYHCAACGAPLFASTAKFDSGSGWPSYWQPVDESALKEVVDTRHGMTRTEVRCAACDSHLGHVFPDGPPPTGLRYCINSLALVLKAEERDK